MTSVKVKINDYLEFELPHIVSNKQGYYSFNLMGRTIWNHEFAKEIVKRINHNRIDALVTIEAKAIGLTQELSRCLGLDRYVVIRKSSKSYMKNPVSVKGSTFISGEAQYWIDGHDVDFLKDKNFVICDDVISTGGTMKSVIGLLHKNDLRPNLLTCAMTEGQQIKEILGIEVVSCGHFPLPGGNDDR